MSREGKSKETEVDVVVGWGGDKLEQGTQLMSIGVESVVLKMISHAHFDSTYAKIGKWSQNRLLQNYLETVAQLYEYTKKITELYIFVYEFYSIWNISQ